MPPPLDVQGSSSRCLEPNPSCAAQYLGKQTLKPSLYCACQSPGHQPSTPRNQRPTHAWEPEHLCWAPQPAARPANRPREGGRERGGPEGEVEVPPNGQSPISPSQGESRRAQTGPDRPRRAQTKKTKRTKKTISFFSFFSFSSFPHPSLLETEQFKKEFQGKRRKREKRRKRNHQRRKRKKRNKRNKRNKRRAAPAGEPPGLGQARQHPRPQGQYAGPARGRAYSPRPPTPGGVSPASHSRSLPLAASFGAPREPHREALQETYTERPGGLSLPGRYQLALKIGAKS